MATEICREIGHDFEDGPLNPEPGEQCRVCGIIYCPVAYDHDEELGYCNVCGWNRNYGLYYM